MWSSYWSARTRGFLVIAVMILVISGAMLWWDVLAHNHAPVAWAVAADALVAFFGTLIVLGGDTKDRVRTAITICFVVTYFVLLGLVTFLSTSSDAQSPAASGTLVTNFTALMGVVVAFYFGSTTVEHVAKVNAIAANPAAAPALDNVSPD